MLVAVAEMITCASMTLQYVCLAVAAGAWLACKKLWRAWSGTLQYLYSHYGADSVAISEQRYGPIICH